MSCPLTRYPLALVAFVCGGACTLDHGVNELQADDLVGIGVSASPAGDTASTPVLSEPGRRMGEFKLTYYWMAKERDLEGGPERVLYTAKGCQPVATVTAGFARRLDIEGTGQLRDGRVINRAGPCDCPGLQCYFVVAKHKRWGVGVGKKPLSPFRTVAVDPRQVPLGTMLYIPELDGLTMPGREPWGGFVHDGCVLAGDRGAGVEGNQLDFFVAQRVNYALLNHRHRLKKVTVFEGSVRCQRKGYTVAALRGSS
jgi:3D (Asp-Asp-Asp) domain-containing protein